VHVVIVSMNFFFKTNANGNEMKYLIARKREKRFLKNLLFKDHTKALIVRIINSIVKIITCILYVIQVLTYTPVTNSYI
jgi:hypothetical protein